MAEMTTLSAAIYRTFETSLAPGFEDTTPGITARFELFYDVRFPKVMVGHRLSIIPVLYLFAHLFRNTAASFNLPTLMHNSKEYRGFSLIRLSDEGET